MKTKLENSISTNIISSTSENGVKVFRLTGSWRSAEISKISKGILITINKSTQEDLAIVDLLEITEIDTIGVATIIYFTEKYRGKIQLQGMTAHMEQLFSIMSLNPNNKLKQKNQKIYFLMIFLENCTIIFAKRLSKASIILLFNYIF
ncbi:ABC transporter [Candidatus Liberibacter solanacearum CLso-ZC1]|uniref:ABC transporter n=1 Tax=Liberibacter solanacearum (strain CLso-ZC1) TaxID=658172 RepID=E4UDR2_LIBSC|nr:ABC transporter [Candidatus Liberibacter solanacearum]ADR52740.1 ABC transporter [Candidatus Liberibacter solanacearum CLso-ZC1]